MVGDYEFDAFVSFRRWQEWPRWVAEHFEPLFVLYLGEELGRAPRVFVDWQDRTPGDWTARLGQALARSRVLVPLLSRMYFDSPWCVAEYDLMQQREQRLGCDLIVPAVIHDGGDLPAHAQRANSAMLRKFANPRMAKDSPKGEQLADAIAEWAAVVRAAIEAAPPYDPAWERGHVEAMGQTFVEAYARQDHVPSWAG